jgi:hypothetical protein
VKTITWARTACSRNGWLYCCERHERAKATPFALWAKVGGNAVVLCRHHLDMWLDNADDDPDLEPDRLVFLTS